MNIFFIGSTGALSTIPLKALLSTNHSIVGMGISTKEALTLKSIPVCNGDALVDTVEGIALNSGKPVINLFNINRETLGCLERLQIDIIYVSCFASRLPQELLSIPRLGCFNVHPSYLPAYRGPMPLFWQLRDGLNVIGVSLHRVTTDFDAGPVVAQKNLRLAAGSDNDEISSAVANIAGGLLIDHLVAVGKGAVIESPQNEAVASYQSFPVEKDFELDNQWSNLRCYNFVCATRHLGSHFYTLGDVVYRLNGEVRYIETNCSEKESKCADNQEKILKLVSRDSVLIAQFF